MIIGLTGPNASGKGEAANYIKSKGFIYYSLSDILREEAKKQGIEPLRENLIKLGNDLRQEKGASILALRLTGELSKKGNYIVDSIRNPGEVEALKKIPGFIMVGIDAPLEKRFERSLKRKRPGDGETLKNFIEKENKENKKDAQNQQLKKCIGMADVIIVNDSSIEELYRKIDGALKERK